MRLRINTYLATLFGLSLILLLVFYTVPHIKEGTSSLFASVFFKNSIETSDILKRYSQFGTSKRYDQKIKVLIVPGHDEDHSGAQFQGVREADLNLKLGLELFKQLSKEEKLEVVLTRNNDGYDPGVKQYLDQVEKSSAFRAAKVKIMDELVASGKVRSYVNVHHNTALPEVASILYGINRFANHHDYDLVLHIHFNDYPGRTGSDGKHSGFAIYVPERQYSNAEASKDFAQKIKDQLLLISAESDLPNEEAITEDQELIAIGSFNTLDAAAALIEYGYIYEPQFTDPAISEWVLRELAQQTYYGIMQYLEDGEAPISQTYASLKYVSLHRDLGMGVEGLDVLALQDRLRDQGHYPPHGDLNACPLSGHFGECTKNALVEFQRSEGIDPSGFFGEATRRKLDERMQQGEE